MTDTSQYTGTHKERFDESGKGRGAAGHDSTSKGRASVPALIGSQPGYVAGYKNEGKYGSSGGSPSPSTKKRVSVVVISQMGGMAH